MYIEQKQDRILKPHSVYTKSAEEDNQITTELLNLITEAGLTPSADDLTQVKTAVLSLGGGSGGSGHVVGEIVSSTLPITDAGFHLLDGALISGSGTYAAFVDYIGDLYDNTPSSGYQYNVNIVGSLANTDGVLSGFSTSNYCLLPSAFSPSTSSWELVIKITTGIDVSTTQYILGREYYFDLYISGGLIKTDVGNSSAWGVTAQAGITTLQANTTYYIKYVYTGSNYEIYLSTDGNTFTLEKTISYSTAQSSNTIPIGKIIASSSLTSFYGSIDLNESYINVNNNRWWTGATPSWVTDEAQWQTSVSTYGVCGKFVYDSVNNTVRLPKITGIIEGTTDAAALGDLVAAGLPNITGQLVGSGDRTSMQGAYGAFYGDGSTGTGSSSSSVKGYINLYLDASRSSSIYGNSATVQPQTIKTLYYICIATTTKTDIQADIDEIASDLNLKAETDLSNLTAAGNIYGSKLYAPSSVNEAVTIGSSGADYTAPSNGWVYAQGTQSSSGGWMALVNATSGIISRAQTSYNNSIHNVYIPVQKGDTFQLHWANVGSRSLTFVYAEGSKTEA